MNFSNLAPADRLKASAMIGAIVLVMIFLVHTIMGAVAPKKPTNNSAAATQAVQNPPPAPPKAEVAGNSEAGLLADGGLWPVNDTLNGSGTGNKVTDDPVLKQAVTDPFIPTIHPDAKKPTLPPTKPLVNVTPTNQGPSLPPTGGPSTGWPPGPNFNGQPNGLQGTNTALAPVAPPPPAEPQIRLVGIVVGEPSVATLEVDGRIVLARSGEAIIDGYRLMNIDGEGIRVRHGKKMMELRSGVTINQPRPLAGATPAH
jgi:hypothetical protein